jgi:uncharacterized protein (UPF0276 family)
MGAAGTASPQWTGVGIGLRREHHDAVLATGRRLDWLEFVPENFMERGGAALEVLSACARRWPVAAHGVELNLGGQAPIEASQLAALEQLFCTVQPRIYSEHLCLVEAGGVRFHELLPLPNNLPALRHVCARINHVQRALGVRLALENVSTYARIPGSTMTEGAFMTAVLQETGASLMLDVNNVYVSARNQGVDPLEMLHALPLSQTVQMHLAGHRDDGVRVIDHHGAPISQDVWDLYAVALRHTAPVPVLVEWDTNIPALDRVLDEADRARAMMDTFTAPLGARAPAEAPPWVQP